MGSEACQMGQSCWAEQPRPCGCSAHLGAKERRDTDSATSTSPAPGAHWLGTAVTQPQASPWPPSLEDPPALCDPLPHPCLSPCGLLTSWDSSLSHLSEGRLLGPFLGSDCVGLGRAPEAMFK